MFFRFFFLIGTHTTILPLFAASVLSSDVRHDHVQITFLDVPLTILEGDDVEFRCEFNSSVKMYSIKWYRNDKEFFYFIPSLKPSKRVLPMLGVNVDVTKSNGQVLFLRNVNLDTEGRFKCEVSTEWPHYYTADKSHFVTIVVLPDEKPTIKGALDQYHLGDRLELLCVSSPSKPEAKLSWLINGREAPPELLKKGISSEEGILQRTRLSLGFVVTQKDFMKGRLLLSCSAHVASYSFHEEIVFNVPVIDVEERSALAEHATSAVKSAPTEAGTQPSFLLLLNPFLLLLWRREAPLT